MTTFKIKVKNFLILFTLAAFGAAGVYGLFQNKVSAAGFQGAIYTTTFDGQSVNQNKYSNKNAVYLNGGPQNANANGLPDGTYYFQVTDPSGSTLLSTDPAECRQLLVVNGRVAGAAGPCPHPTGLPNSSNGSTPVKLAPFNNTPNNGGMYKVWLIRQTANTTISGDGLNINFNNSNAKTDNFKVVFVPCTNCGPTVTLSGKKFYDANQNALFDVGEAPVQGVKFVLTFTTSGGTDTTIVTTDESGNWSFGVPTGAEYEIGEYLPYTSAADGSYWAQTSPVADGEGFQGYRGTASGNHANLNFGDVCYNSNGAASETPCGVSYVPPTSSPTPTPTPCTDDCGPTVTLSGTKFYDVNGNASFDVGEVPVQGVKISVVYPVNGDTTTNIVITDESGNWSMIVPTGAEYKVSELPPNTGDLDTIWLQTAPLADAEGFQGYSGTANANQTGFNFGNVCVSVAGAEPEPCPVSYNPPPTPPPTPEPTPTPTPCTVDCGPTVTLSGQKFYDANANGFNDGEVSVQGVRIAVLLTTGDGTTVTVVTTNADGNWSLEVPVGAQYIIGEYVPDTDPLQDPGSYWEQTAPAANDEGFRGFSGTASEDQSGLNFGDVCYRPDGGGNPVASATPCTVFYPAPPPRDNQ